MAFYSCGEEPEKLKKRMKTLFNKLDSAYPDKIIVGLHTNHKKWGETVTALYRELGYPDGKSFLEAYGYQYASRIDNPGGRPKSVDPEAIIKEFQEKYPNGSPFKKVEELFAGTEYESKLKTIQNQSKEVFGMPLGKYLLSIGLLQPKVKKSEEKPVAKDDQKTDKEPEIKKIIYKICKVKLTAVDETIYYTAQDMFIHEGAYVEVPIGASNLLAFGRVEEVVISDEDSTPCDVAEAKAIVRQVGIREYSEGLLRSVLHANAAIETDQLIKEAADTAFNRSDYNDSKTARNVSWAYCKGLSAEILKVMDYLVEKDDWFYKYKDLILLSPGISGLFVYEDYINDVMAKYPNIKIAMFAKNKDSGIIDLCYSRSGYPGITDSYPIGKNVSGSNEDWTLRHSPTEDFTDGDIAFTFKFRDDWDAVNYVYTDEKGAGRQLGK